MKPASKKDPSKLKLAEKRELANDDANLLSNCVREMFCVHSPKEAMHMLQESSRVASDLNKAVDANRGSVLVFRAFQQCQAGDEFRCFVHDGKLTGISQYCYSQFFPSVVKRKAQIQSALQSFFQDSFLPRSPVSWCWKCFLLLPDLLHPSSTPLAWSTWCCSGMTRRARCLPL